LALLLGVADRGGSRREVLRTIGAASRGRGIFAESREDLTPVRIDPPSLIPLAAVTGRLLLRPRAAHHIATGTVSAYSLTPAAVETIMALNEERAPASAPVVGWSASGPGGARSGR
jgi:hypothetical protein